MESHQLRRIAVSLHFLILFNITIKYQVFARKSNSILEYRIYLSKNLLEAELLLF